MKKLLLPFAYIFLLAVFPLVALINLLIMLFTSSKMDE